MGVPSVSEPSWGRTAVFAALGLLLSVGAVSAQTAEPETAPDAPPPPSYDRTFSDARSWRDLVAGKTLYYYLGEDLVGREYYPRNGGDRVVFEYWDKTCFEGSWTEVGGVFCFSYDAVHCFTHHEREGVLIARQMNGEEQSVQRITEETLSCAPELHS